MRLTGGTLLSSVELVVVVDDLDGLRSIRGSFKDDFDDSRRL
jgi:hypothetical protein